MHTLRTMAGVLLLLMLLCFSASAVEPEDTLIEGVDPQEGLTQEITDLIGSFDMDASQDFGKGLGNIFSSAVSQSSSSIKQGIASAAVILASMMLCGIFRTDERSEKVTAIVGALAIAAACAGNLHAMVGLGSSTITSLNHYSLVLLPSLTTLLASSGAVTTSTVVFAGAMLFLELLMTLIAKLLIPMVYLYVALAAAEAAMDNEMLTKLRDFVKWLTTTCLKGIVYLFTGYLTVSGILCGSADAARLRAAKLTISGTVPVVGGIISDASETLLSAAGVIKSAVGTYGMLAVLGICLIPFLQIAVQYLTLKATTAVGGMLGRKCHVTLVENMASAVGLLLAMTGAYTLMIVLSIALCMKAVGI